MSTKMMKSPILTLMAQTCGLQATANERIKVEGHGVTRREFIEKFSHYIANNVSKPFNKVENLLEANTDTFVLVLSMNQLRYLIQIGLYQEDTSNRSYD